MLEAYLLSPLFFCSVVFIHLNSNSKHMRLKWVMALQNVIVGKQSKEDK